MTFPKRLRFNGRGKPLATIYKNLNGGFTLYWRQRRAVDGKPATHLKDFRTYRRPSAKATRWLPTWPRAGLPA